MSSYISGLPDPLSTTREPVAPIKEAISSDVEFIEKRDVLGGNVVIQEYAQVQQWRAHTSYQATASVPVLELPNPEEHSGPSPFEPSWQKATRDFFRNRVREMVMQKIKESGKPMPSESQIQEQVNALIKAHVEGKPLNNSDQEIIRKATKETQEVHKLPSSWHFSTQNITDWTPITTDVVPPANVDLARKEFICVNLEQLLVSCEDAAKRISRLLAPEDPNQAALKDFYLVITKALRELKSILMEFQRVEGETADKTSKAKFDEVQVREKIVEEMHKKNEEANEARRKQEGTAKVMKIVSPILSAVVNVLSVAATIASGGLGSPLIIAGLAVSTTLTAYTVAESAGNLNLTGQLMEALKPFLESTVAKVLFISALVVVVAIAVVLSGGAAAAKIATMTTSEAVKQTMKEMVKQLTIHFATILLMSSNVLPELIVEALLKTGVINDQDEEGKMIAQIIIMAVIMVALLFVAAKARGPAKAGGAPKTSDSWMKQLQDWAKGFKDSFAMKKDPARILQLAQDAIKAGQLGTEIYSGALIGAIGKELSKLYREQGDIEKAQEIVQALIQLLTALLNSAQQGLSQQGEWIKNIDRAFDALDESIRQDMRAGQFAA